MEFPFTEESMDISGEDKIVNLRSLLESDAPPGTIIKLGINVDGINGTLSLYRTHGSTPNKYNLDFSFIKLCCETITVIDKYCRTEDDLFEEIRNLSKRKITYNESFLESDLPKYKTVRDGIYELLGKTVEQCYVCLDDSYGHKTKCGHDICIQCYMKSVDNRTFTCGVCREYEDCC